MDKKKNYYSQTVVPKAYTSETADRLLNNRVLCKLQEKLLTFLNTMIPLCISTKALFIKG